MTEKGLQRTFIWGTALFLVVLVGMSRDSLRQISAGRTPALTDAAIAGKHAWSRKNCNDCHTILGIGGYFAPELTKVADRRDPAWLQRFLADPQAAKPGTTMPNQRLSQADVMGLVAFFDWVRHIDTNGWPPAPRAMIGGGGAERPVAPGAYRTKGCTGCHMVDAQGASGPGPDLSHIGSTPYDGMANSPEFLARWLDDPPGVKPGTMMPQTALSPGDRDSLVRYLTALR
jgi:nitric oxide reductase subunit C